MQEQLIGRSHRIKKLKIAARYLSLLLFLHAFLHHNNGTSTFVIMMLARRTNEVLRYRIQKKYFKNMRYYWKYENFCQLYDKRKFQQKFRFKKREIVPLRKLLKIPDIVISDNRYAY
jgi:hypothetical protein